MLMGYYVEKMSVEEELVFESRGAAVRSRVGSQRVYYVQRGATRKNVVRDAFVSGNEVTE